MTAEHTDKLIMSETIDGSTSEETIELLLNNLREQVLARCKRAGFVVDASKVRGIVRGQRGPAARRVEVWATYEQLTPERRAKLAEAYTDGLQSARTFRAVTREEHVPVDEAGEPLHGHAWAEYVGALAVNPYESPEIGLVTGETEVLAVAWRRGWDELGEALANGRAVHGAPYLRIVRP